MGNYGDHFRVRAGKLFSHIDGRTTAECGVRLHRDKKIWAQFLERVKGSCVQIETPGGDKAHRTVGRKDLEAFLRRHGHLPSEGKISREQLVAAYTQFKNTRLAGAHLGIRHIRGTHDQLVSLLHRLENQGFQVPKTLYDEVETHQKDAQGIISLTTDMLARQLPGGRNALLYLACMDGNRRLAQSLLKKWADPNVKNSDGQTPLHLACLHGDLAMATLLARQGADIHAQDFAGKTPLEMAASKGYTWMEKAVREASRPPFDFDGLKAALTKKDMNAASQLIDKANDVQVADERGWTPLHYVARMGSDESIIEKLLERGAKIDARTDEQKTPLHLACQNTNSEAIRALVKKGANVNAKNSRGQTPLLHVCFCYLLRKDGVAMAELLLRHGADVNAVDLNEQTPLHLAARFGAKKMMIAKKMVELLIQHPGIRLEAKDDAGKTPVDLANEEENAVCARIIKAAITARKSD